MAVAPKSVEDIFAQIEALKKQANEQKEGIIADIKRKIELLDLRPSDLFEAFELTASSQQKPIAVKTPAKVKYRHPDGSTWTGKGRAPKWMLDDNKKIKEEYAVKE